MGGDEDSGVLSEPEGDMGAGEELDSYPALDSGDEDEKEAIGAKKSLLGVNKSKLAQNKVWGSCAMV